MLLRLKVIDPLERAMLREIAKLWFKYLLGRKSRNVSVTISIEDIEIGSGKGYTLNTVDNKFVIGIQKHWTLSQKLRILAHEVTHVAQYVLGDLSDSKDCELVYWKTRTFRNDSDYWQQPWEKQAYKNENVLMRVLVDYCEERKLNIIPPSTKARLKRDK